MKPIRMPGDLEVPMKLFGRFTVKDLIRLSLPTIPGFLTTSLLTAVIGVVIGISWYIARPYGQPIDTHLYHLLRGQLWRDKIKGSDIGDLESTAADTGVDEKKIKTTAGSLVAVIQVKPTNLDLKTGAEQQAIHSIYQDLLETVNYPIQIHSRQQQLNHSQYLETVEKIDTGNPGKSDYIEYCEDFEENNLTRTQHYIVIHTEPDSISYIKKRIRELRDKEPDSDEEALGNELDSRCREIIEEIDTVDLSAQRLTGSSLGKFADNVDNQTEKITSKLTEQDEYRRVIQIDEYPSNVEIAWPLQLLRTQGRVDVIQAVKPCKPGKTTKKLRRVSEKLNAEIDSLLAGGHRGTNKIESLLDDTEWFLNLLADREAQPVDYGSCLVVHSNSKDVLKNTFNKVCNRLDTLGFEYSHPFLKADIAYRSESPLYRNRFNNSLLVPATSAAAGFPFATQDTEDSGVIHGTDAYDNTPILLNRFTWSSHSMARMGMVGSGKSYAAKIELLRSALIYDNLEIIVVDPKQEYKHLVQTLGGQVECIDHGEYSLDNEATCLTVEERGQKENVEALVEAVERIYSHVSQTKQKTLVMIDEARILLNDEDGRRILNQFVLEGRDTNTAITLITQNASHFTHCREGREILDNMPGKIFMRHDRVPDSVVDYFDFSQREKQELFELRTGTESAYSEALLHVSGQVKTRLRINSTAQEHKLIKGGEK